MKKKSFTDPTMLFMSDPEPESEPVRAVPEPEIRSELVETESTYAIMEKIRMLQKEHKSKRLQLLIRPSIHRRLKSIADSRGQSLNDLICEIIEGWLIDHERSENERI